MEIKQKLKVQVISENDKKWPYVGNGYANKNGSLTIYLDEGVALTGGQKLYVAPARPRDEVEDKDKAA